MEITLTNTQWIALQALVAQGVQAQARLGLPIEIINSVQKIEIEANEIKITLDD